MRRLFLFALPLMMTSFPVTAQTDMIGLFTDSGYNECNLNDTSTGNVSVYVVHSPTSGARGAQFKVVPDAGVTMSYLGEASPWMVTLGNTQTGLSVAYNGECHNNDILVTTISYLSFGSSTACSAIRVVADPNAPTGAIEVVNCGQSKMEAIGSLLIVNSDGTCDCGPSTQFTNWGVIKLKYD